MNEESDPPYSRRRLNITIGALIAAGILCFFVLIPCTMREIGIQAVLGRDISDWSQIDTAVRMYHLEFKRYPASLDDPELQPYLGEGSVRFLREGRVTYHPPAADSPPTFILVHMTTPRGNYSTQLDGTRIYPNSKQPAPASPPPPP